MKRSAAATIRHANITMLGGLSLEVDGVKLSDEINRSQKLWNVLAYLIVHRDRAVPQSEFIEQFWPDDRSSSPVNALKTLLYRIRAMLEPLFGEETQPILAQRGAYCWNPDIHCAMDTDQFEELCTAAADAMLPTEQRLELYRKAVRLFRGDFLPKLSGSLWAVGLSAHYHTLYLDAVKQYACLLEETERFGDMADLCAAATAIDPLDETIHVLMIRAMLRQGKNAAALTHYEKATELLYRNLGVRPSEELRGLYSEIMAVEQGLEMDLEVIQSDLREAANRPGAFVCEYGFFREAYRLEARRCRRNGACVHVALVTVAQPDGQIPALKVLNQTMDQLLEVLTTNLRQGDVVAKYSGAQYVVMLPYANFEDSMVVMDRVVSAFYRQHRRNFLKITTKIREVELN